MPIEQILPIDPQHQAMLNVKPMVDAFYRLHTAVIMIEDGNMDKHPPRPFGSGVFALVDGVPGVLTARHVWDEGKKVGRVKVGSFYLSEKAENKIRRTWFTPTGVIFADDFKGFKLDLAFIVLKQEDYQKAPEIFLGDDMIDCENPIFDRQHLVAGYPGEFVRDEVLPDNSPSSNFGLFSFYSGLVPQDMWHPSYSQECHLLVIYAPEMYELTHGPNPTPSPKGMSGGGIWRARETKNKIITMRDRLSLVGIECEWWGQKGKFLAGTQIGFLIEAIKKRSL